MKKSLLSLVLVVVGSAYANNEQQNDAFNQFNSSSNETPAQNPLGDRVDQGLEDLKKYAQSYLGSFFKKEVNQQVATNVVVEPAKHNTTTQTHDVKEAPKTQTEAPKTQLEGKGSSTGGMFGNVKEIISPKRMQEIKTYLHAHQREILAGVAAVVLVGGTLYIVYQTGAVQKLSSWIKAHPKTVATVVLTAAVVAAAGVAYSKNAYGFQTKADAIVALAVTKLKAVQANYYKVA